MSFSYICSTLPYPFLLPYTWLCTMLIYTIHSNVHRVSKHLPAAFARRDSHVQKKEYIRREHSVPSDTFFMVKFPEDIITIE